MDLNNTLTFGGINTATYGIFIDGSGTFNSPERDVTMITVPGRSGQLALDNGRFENIEVTYRAFVTEKNGQTFAENIRDFRNAIGALRGYQRLSDTYHTDEFRQALFRNGIEIEPVVYQTGGEFALTFDCKPQRWLTITENVADATADPQISDLTVFDAKPLIIIRYLTGASTGTAEFCGEYNVDLDFTQAQQTANVYGEREVFIDCELMDAYEYETFTNDRENTGAVISANSWVSCPDGFPIIPADYQGAAFCTNYSSTPSAKISAVLFIGRYWRI